MSLPMTLGLGMLLGARHAVDADHLIVVATMVERERGLSGALRTAALWSIGHACTFLGVGLAIVVLGLRVPASFEQAAELAVAFMLIGLGLWHWKSSPSSGDGANSQARMLVRPVAAGVVHGLAGSAGIALLALTTIQTALGAIFYLLAFGAGTVLGMLVSTALLSFPLRLSQRRFREQRCAITTWMSAASIGLGLALLWQALRGN